MSFFPSHIITIVREFAAPMICLELNLTIYFSISHNKDNELKYKF